MESQLVRFSASTTLFRMVLGFGAQLRLALARRHPLALALADALALRADRLDAARQVVASAASARTTASAVATQPKVASISAMKWPSPSLLRTTSSIAGSIQKSKLIILLIITTPMDIQKTAMAAMMRPCSVDHSRLMYFGDKA